MPIKTLGSLGKIRVGRVTGNTHIFFFGLRSHATSVEIAWILQGTCMEYTRNIILFCLNMNRRDINVTLTVFY